MNNRKGNKKLNKPTDQRLALLKALVKFIQDGIDVSRNLNTENTLFELEKLVFTSRGQIGIWLPSNRVETLRNFGTKINQEKQSFSENDSEDARFIAPAALAKEFKTEIGDLCALLQLRHGAEIASDVIKAFFAEDNS